MSDLRKLADLLATFDRCDRDRQPITSSMWDALRSLARKAADDLATVTRERDEARARIATIDKDVGRLQDVVRVALCDAVKGTIPTANLSRIDGGCSDGDEFEFTATEVSIACGMLTEEIDELRAALLNERGEGEPPSEGWAPVDATPGRWEHHARGWCCYRIKTREYIVVERGSLSGELAREKTAREAMRAADTALAGGKS